MLSVDVGGVGSAAAAVGRIGANVSVIDPTQAVIATITVGSGPINVATW